MTRGREHVQTQESCSRVSPLNQSSRDDITTVTEQLWIETLEHQAFKEFTISFLTYLIIIKAAAVLYLTEYFLFYIPLKTKTGNRMQLNILYDTVRIRGKLFNEPINSRGIRHGKYVEVV